jgi:hypothetical protein
MGYEWDVFLSYKRHPEARQWLIDHFEPLLEYYVGEELGYRPRLFRDEERTDAGVAWPSYLGKALGGSRVLVALWTRTYFYSEWCTLELSTMLAREHDEQFRTAQQPAGLIIPVILHDCEDLEDWRAAPEPLAPITHVTAIRDCFRLRMRRDSEQAEILEHHIAKLVAPGVAQAIKAAPAWREQWPLTAAEAFLALVRKPGQPRQTEVPRMSR